MNAEPMDLAVLPPDMRDDAKELIASALSLESRYGNYVVKTAEAFETGAEDLRAIKGASDRLEKARTAITGPINEGLKRINALFAGPKTRLLNLETKVKGALLGYQREQERIRAEHQRKLDEAAEAERKRLQAIADAAAAKGQEKKAETFATRAQTVVAPVLPERTVPKVSGLSTREKWVVRIKDPNKIPREFMTPDLAKIDKLAKAMKKDAEALLGGPEAVEVYNDPVLASGRS